MKRKILSALLLTALLLTALLLSACGGGDGGIPEDAAQPAASAQSGEPSAGIRAVTGRNCNYVYHMLSVSNCGYDNAYGRTHRVLHDEADLQILKQYEGHITVSGGEYAGDLYALCVSLPASLDDEVSLPLYYEALADLFGTGELERNFGTYQSIYEQSFGTMGAAVDMESMQEFYRSNEPLKEEIAAISNVMAENYGVYSDQVWESTRAELSPAADALNQLFESADYMGKWEAALQARYGRDVFAAMLCNSMEGGPNCIDISPGKDVFYPTGEPDSTAAMISHEFGIYLLKDLLRDTAAFQDFSCYELVESLAEYYNTPISGGYAGWDLDPKYADYYQQLREQEPEITPKELFLRAADHFASAAAEG